ncbi:MAG: hypothetical protein FJ264_10030 [Planctomycetes bacterium]|nr:hypothetical protein [Planctomycetota bacterium]
MKKLLFLICFFLLTSSLSSVVSLYAQATQESNQTGEPISAQQQPPPLPEITPTPRSKLEIIQYILLPFAIGASIWLILRLDKMEQEEKDEGKEK